MQVAHLRSPSTAHASSYNVFQHVGRSSSSTLSTVEDTQQLSPADESIQRLTFRKRRRVTRSGTSAIFSSSPLSSGNASIIDQFSNSTLPDDVPQHLSCASNLSAREQHILLAAASTTFDVARRYLVHRATINMQILERDSPDRSGIKRQNPLLHSVNLNDDQDEEYTVEDVTQSSFSDQMLPLEYSESGASGESLNCTKTARLERRDRHADYIERDTWVSDSLSVGSANDNVNSHARAIDYATLTSSPSVPPRNREISSKYSPAFVEIDNHEQICLQTDPQVGIDMMQSRMFATPPPKLSSLRSSQVEPSALSYIHASFHGDSCMDHAITSEQPLRTPQNNASSAPLKMIDSSDSTYTSPDRLPEKYPVFSATLTLREVLGSKSKREVFFVSLVEHESSSKHNGITNKGPRDGQRVGKHRIDSNGDQKNNMKLSILQNHASSLIDCSDDRILTKTLARQLKAAFRKSDYYTPRAQCVRTKRMVTEELRFPNQANALLDTEWPPQEHEHGFWRINVSTWTADEKIRFWKNVSRVVESGRIGWVRMVIEADSQSSDGDVVRFYCFGKVVVHIWMFLVIMSDRRVIRSEVTWIDSCGRTVIQMKHT
ncbi:uncharacterized protein V2V93DRAFT_364449 [Kockiozyma suomiensis]|uniref:uncharacterized protein n=1 Tax=Kockiozyma suomiensis TaxID=1337062 RepID=UPI0033433391